jgi:hypothetical protein
MIRDFADRNILDRIGRLLEEERRLPVRVAAALDGMRGVTRRSPSSWSRSR